MTASPLSGKTALVTGSSRGIGRAIALRLARDGARVALHASKPGGADDSLRAVTEAGGNAFALAADLATQAGVENLAAMFLAANGGRGPDILVNNAGIQISQAEGIGRMGGEDFDRLVAVNVKAPFFLVQKLLASLPEGGRIVNLSSRLSTIGFPEQIVYSMTKAAINSFTKSLARELGPRGITVNAVGPGIIDTDMTRDRLLATDQQRAAVAGMSALKRTGNPEDIADIVAFLTGPDARWITGQYIDGTGGTGLG